MWLLVAVGCVHAPVPPVAAAGAVAVDTLAVAPEPPPPPAPPPPPPPLLPPPPPPTDALALTNAWKVHHNAALDKLNAGDPKGALVLAGESLAEAPADRREGPLVLIVMASTETGDRDVEFAALTELEGMPGAPWAAFYNGSMDAVTAGRRDLAHHYAQIALTRTDDPATVAPYALHAALAIDALDDAVKSWQRMPGAIDPGGRADLVRALVKAGRCPDAQKVDPGACQTAPSH